MLTSKRYMLYSLHKMCSSNNTYNRAFTVIVQVQVALLSFAHVCTVHIIEVYVEPDIRRYASVLFHL